MLLLLLRSFFLGLILFEVRAALVIAVFTCLKKILRNESVLEWEDSTL